MESDDIRGTEVLEELADPVLWRIFQHFKQVSQGARWRLVRYPQPLPFAWVALRAFEVDSWEPLFTTLTQRDRPGEAWFIHGEGPPEAEFRSRHSLEDFVAKDLTPRALNIELGVGPDSRLSPALSATTAVSLGSTAAALVVLIVGLVRGPRRANFPGSSCLNKPRR